MAMAGSPAFAEVVTPVGMPNCEAVIPVSVSTPMDGKFKLA
jgi:hypothetical protein